MYKPELPNRIFFGDGMNHYSLKPRVRKTAVQIGTHVCFFFVLFCFVFKLFIYLFMVGSSFLCEGFLQLRRAGATLHRGARASPVAEHRLQTRRPSNCGPRAQPLRGTWDPPRPGPEPALPALAGRLPTTAPPGKPPCLFCK